LEEVQPDDVGKRETSDHREVWPGEVISGGSRVAIDGPLRAPEVRRGPLGALRGGSWSRSKFGRGL